jgi:hypothetical protein
MKLDKENFLEQKNGWKKLKMEPWTCSEEEIKTEYSISSNMTRY